MKIIKYISIIIVFVFCTVQLMGQDLEAYILQLPDIILDKGGPIYVLPLTAVRLKTTYFPIF